MVTNVFVTNFKDQSIIDEKTAGYRASGDDFGDVINITEGKVDVFDMEDLLKNISQTLQDNNFDPVKDIILIAGNAIISAAVMRVVSEDYFGETIKVLLYHYKMNDYVMTGS